MYKFETLAKKGKLEGINLNKDAKDARDWFRNQALNLKYANPKQFQKNATAFQNMENLSPNSVGKMYFFCYDPKLKATLPYYDVFPLVYPLAVPYPGKESGFLGINLHYLSPFLRAKLMDALYQTLNNTKYNNTTKLIIDYQILNGAAQYKYFKPCVKHYLFSHVRSPFQYVPPETWDYVSLLPMARFQKKSQEFVWMASMLKV